MLARAISVWRRPFTVARMAAPIRSSVFSGSVRFASLSPTPRRKAAASPLSDAGGGSGAGCGRGGAGAATSWGIGGCSGRAVGGRGAAGVSISQSSGMIATGWGGRKALSSAGAWSDCVPAKGS